MQFNAQQCYMISVTKRGQQLDKKYSLNGHTLKYVDYYPYLGLEFQSDLKLEWQPLALRHKVQRPKILYKALTKEIALPMPDHVIVQQ